MTPELEQRLAQLEAKVEMAYQSSEKVRKYLLYIIWGTIIAFVLPAIGLMFAIPSFINSYMSTMEGLI